MLKRDGIGISEVCQYDNTDETGEMRVTIDVLEYDEKGEIVDLKVIAQVFGWTMDTFVNENINDDCEPKKYTAKFGMNVQYEGSAEWIKNNKEVEEAIEKAKISIKDKWQELMKKQGYGNLILDS